MRAVSYLAPLLWAILGFSGLADSVAINHEVREVAFNQHLSFTPVEGPQPIAKRLTFTSGGRDDYCGETNPTFTYGDATPLAADCAAIGASLAGVTGFWTVEASDFNQSGRWAKIASSGTCQFALQFQLESSIQQMFIGTNDLRFYINSYVGNSQNGHIQAIGTAACNNNTGGVLLLMNWGMIHS